MDRVRPLALTLPLPLAPCAPHLFRAFSETGRYESRRMADPAGNPVGSSSFAAYHGESGELTVDPEHVCSRFSPVLAQDKIEKQLITSSVVFLAGARL